MVFEKFKSRYIKRIIARSFTLSQLIKDDKWNTIFFELSPFADLDCENL